MVDALSSFKDHESSESVRSSCYYRTFVKRNNGNGKAQNDHFIKSFPQEETDKTNFTSGLS